MNSLLDRSDSIDTSSDQNSSLILLSGYLYKKSQSGNWQRRYFETNGSHLAYYKTHKMTKLLAAVSMPQVGAIQVVDDGENHSDREISHSSTVFQIDLKDRQLQLRAATHEEAKKWVTGLISLRDGEFRESGTFLPDAMRRNTSGSSSKSDRPIYNRTDSDNSSKIATAVLWKTSRLLPTNCCVPCCSYLAVNENNS